MKWARECGDVNGAKGLQMGLPLLDSILSQHLEAGGQHPPDLAGRARLHRGHERDILHDRPARPEASAMRRFTSLTWAGILAQTLAMKESDGTRPWPSQASHGFEAADALKNITRWYFWSARL